MLIKFALKDSNDDTTNSRNPYVLHKKNMLGKMIFTPESYVCESEEVDVAPPRALVHEAPKRPDEPHPAISSRLVPSLLALFDTGLSGNPNVELRVERMLT